MYKRIIIFLLIPLMAACSSESPPMEAADRIRPAVLIKVGESITETFLSYPGVIEGETGSELAFSVSGVVKELNVKAAQAVEQGEVLAKLDQRDFQSKLESAQATYNNADKEYQRALRLMEGNAIARSEFQRRKTTLDTAKAQLNIAKKAFGDTVIVAPFAGHVSKVSIEALQTAQAGKTVTIEQGVGSELNVLTGLTPGETIVGAGIDHLSEGMQVRSWSKE